jgi:peptidoglycan/LPS O-acetylase OafA/YrhL
MNRIPTLDGWRGIAILLVIVAHVQVFLLGHTFQGYAWLNFGQHGVSIFFVLSGYLITTLLLEEDKIDLKRFYLRRFFRLMPCAWAYLAFVGILASVRHVHIIGSDTWSCLFFFRNYYPAVETQSNLLTTHFWSLSLEEQFYLTWPPLLVFVGRKWGLRAVAGSAVGCAVFRLIYWNSYARPGFGMRSEVRVDALLVGCGLAFLLKRDAVRAWIIQYGAAVFWICVPIFVWHVYRYQALIPLSESILIATMIACTSVHPGSVPGRVLEWQHLKFTGMMSYSFYVWQQLFLRHSWGPFGILLLGAVGIGSWLLIEQPCIRLGRRLEHRRAAPSVNKVVGAVVDLAEP